MLALIVDDNPTNVMLLQRLVSKVDGCGAICFTDPVAAAAQLGAITFDIALIDYVMPGLDGLKLVQAIRSYSQHEHVPIVVVTSAEDRAVRIDVIEAGANDFLSKPIEVIEFKARVRNLLALRKSQLALSQHAELLQQEIDKAMRDLARREEEIVWRLSRATEVRDSDTGSHIVRMSSICRIIAEEIGLDDKACRLIQVASQMHDIGKVGIPDTILFKPGKLTSDERAIMQKHTTVGESILAGSESELIRTAAEIAATHHERWDGTGYPRRLAGAAIPIAGRLAAVADVFDALISERPYKAPWSLEEAHAFIVAQAGYQFDPICVEAFERRFSEIAAVVKHFRPVALTDQSFEPRGLELTV